MKLCNSLYIIISHVTHSSKFGKQESLESWNQAKIPQIWNYVEENRSGQTSLMHAYHIAKDYLQHVNIKVITILLYILLFILYLFARVVHSKVGTRMFHKHVILAKTTSID